MGLNPNSVEFLLCAKRRGVNFDRTLTIGRQNVYVASALLHKLLSAGIPNSKMPEASRLLEEGCGFSEPLLRLLGATRTDSMDVSRFEGATLIHDLNLPIPENLKRGYSLVVDAGTLEHVFNYPVAIGNCIEMVCQGGHFISICPCNNQMGHGFYQFSPELLFRILSPDNGYHVEQMIICEYGPYPMEWHEVLDPAKVKRRVTLWNNRPADLMVLARRAECKDLFKIVPQQSDYVEAWSSLENAKPESPSRSSSVRAIISKRTPRLAKDLYRAFRPVSPFDKCGFRKCNDRLIS